MSTGDAELAALDGLVRQVRRQKRLTADYAVSRKHL